jgi:hypothetical protein
MLARKRLPRGFLEKANWVASPFGSCLSPSTEQMHVAMLKALSLSMFRQFGFLPLDSRPYHPQVESFFQGLFSMHVLCTGASVCK